jgi:peptide/nickel transport system substrate-binding protein
MKKLFVVLIILLITTIIAGCAAPKPTTPAPTTPKPAPAAPAPATPAPTTPAAPATPAPAAPAPTPAAKPAPAPAQPRYGGILRIVEVAPPGAPIGAEWEGNANTYNTQQWVLQRLLTEKRDGTMAPSMAEKWTIDAVGKPPDVPPSITFNLRKNAKFHDGTEVNAQAIKWNLEIFKKQAMFTSTTNYWKSFDVIDNYTLRVNFTEYRNTLLRSWENYFMVSPSAYEKNGIEWMRTHMVGCGPFKQVDFQRDVHLKTVRVDDYWEEGKPYLEGVHLLYVADETTREALFRSGGAEMLNATPKIAARFQNQPAYNIVTRDGGPTLLIPDSMNADSPWSNLKVRQAAEYAIDREALAKAFGYGFGVAAYQMATNKSMAYDPALPPHKFDPEKAKQLLKEAGFPTGFKSKIIVGSGLDRDPVVAIQAALKAVGIDVDLDFPEPAKFQQIWTSPWNNALLYWPLGEWSNFNTTLNVFFADPGTFYWKSLKKPDGWKDLYARSLRAPSPDPAILKEVGDAFFNDCTVIPLVYSTAVFVLSSKVQDKSLGNLGTPTAWNYQDVWLSK